MNATGTLPRAESPWAERVATALADEEMRRSIARTTRNFDRARRAVYAEYPEAETMRQAGRDAKAYAIAHLDEMLTQLQSQVEAHGGHLFCAATPDQANDYVLQVARRRGVKRVIKSKSMVTEETGLNAYLEAAGLHVRETDLGEYIIQLAHEHPSHILAPAAHKNRGQISKLFHEEAGARAAEPPRSEETQELAAFARQQLRTEFLQADMGVSGGNFLVAETGTLVLISNEGNGRMVTSLPPVHVALVGIEKVIPTWRDLGNILQQAALSGTGQRMSVYVSLVTGPRHAGELDGPEEFHLVLLDNGRSALRGTEYEDVLRCIRCGACLNTCPVYRNIGGHAYGTTYSGPVGAVLTPLLAGTAFMPELPKSACSLCNACVEACPMEIDLPRHFISLRRELVESKQERWLLASTYRAWSNLWARPGGYRRSVQLARLAQPFLIRDGMIKKGPGIAGGWTATRDMPPVARTTFHEWWTQRGGQGSGERL
mgnify:CR=1 FL=1